MSQKAEVTTRHLQVGLVSACDRKREPQKECVYKLEESVCQRESARECGVCVCVW